MSRPGKKQVNRHLRQAVSSMVSDHAEELWNTPVQKAESDAWFLEGTDSRRRSTHAYYRWAGLAAACLAVFLLGWFYIYRFTDATVFLDVNPGVSIDVNRLGRVVSAKADNEDGRIILDNMDLKGTKIDIVMNALLGSLYKHGYLSQAQNTLLISVNGRDQTRTSALRQKLSLDAEQTLEMLLGSGIILEQDVDLDDATEELAEHYGTTPGKAALIIRLLADQPEWNVSELAAMPVTDLIRYCRTSGIDISRYLGENGEVLGDLSILDDDDDDDHDDDDHDDDDHDNDDSENDDHDSDNDDHGNDDNDRPDESDNPDDHDDPDESDDPDDHDDPDESDDVDESDDPDDYESMDGSNDPDDRNDESNDTAESDDPDDHDDMDESDDPDDHYNMDDSDDPDDHDDDDVPAGTVSRYEEPEDDDHHPPAETKDPDDSDDHDDQDDDDGPEDSDDPDDSDDIVDPDDKDDADDEDDEDDEDD